MKVRKTKFQKKVEFMSSIPKGQMNRSHKYVYVIEASRRKSKMENHQLRSEQEDYSRKLF